MKKSILILILVLLLYVGSYVLFRNSHVEVWEEDGQEYVIFPDIVSYYIYRPVSYVDAKWNDMNFHIGPHQVATGNE